MSDDEDTAAYEDLGRTLAEAIDKLETVRPFAGGMEAAFTVPLDDGTEYEVAVKRKLSRPEQVQP